MFASYFVLVALMILLGVFLAAVLLIFFITVPRHLEDISKELRFIRKAIDKDDENIFDDF